jgi:uncharacterized protein YqgV (UPF0045/DUF77 family)
MSKGVIKFELSIAHVNMVFTALAKLPYEQVAATIAEMQQQIHMQKVPQETGAVPMETVVEGASSVKAV